MNLTLDGATLVPTIRKPFRIISEGLPVLSGGGGGNRINNQLENKELQDCTSNEALPEQNATEDDTLPRVSTPAPDEIVTEPIQNPHAEEHQKCAIYVPRDSLPDDLPPAVVAGLRGWHKLPGHIRTAVEALLKGASE